MLKCLEYTLIGLGYIFVFIFCLICLFIVTFPFIGMLAAYKAGYVF